MKNRMLYVHTFDTPLGSMVCVVNDKNELTHLGFGEEFSSAKPFAWKEMPNAAIVRQVGEYFEGKRQTFDLPLAPDGTDWQKRVWNELQQIPFGQTTTYGEIAKKLGNPAAARAVGRANATNPICLVIPCHRVVGANGTLTGYAFGTSRKEKLLALESALSHNATLLTRNLSDFGKIPAMNVED